MNAVGIVAEFDPFHNGHQYLIDCAKRDLSPDGIVVVMSGDFVQRGGPAFQDKFTRAQTAVRCGADLVIELPCISALDSAEGFAEGAVRIFKELGCITHIAFGSESGDLPKLQRAAFIAAEEPPQMKDELKRRLDEGVSYPAAYECALVSADPSLAGLFTEAPNDVLALEYLKANLKYNAGLIPYSVKRRGTGHANTTDSEDGFASASYIRSCIGKDVDIKNLSYLLPQASAAGIAAEHLTPADTARYFDLIRYELITKTPQEIASVYGVREGLENRLKKAVQTADCLDSLILQAKSKRYTYLNLSRILARMILGISGELAAQARNSRTYARVLAFNETGQQLLRQAKKTASAEIIVNLNNRSQQNDADNVSLSLDIKAADVYSVIRGNKDLYSASDYVNPPRLQG